MKKALILGLSLSLALTLTACGGSNDNAADNSQDTSTPEITQPVDTSTPEVEQTTQTTQDTPVEETPVVETPAVEETPTVEETPAPEVEAQPEVQLFTDCNETVYATTTVNVRDTYSTSGNKVGSLTKAQSVTRTGTGQGEAAGWSRIEFNGQVAYVNSDYLSTTKPQVSTSSGSGGSSSNSGSTQTSKPSTSKPSTSKPSTSSGSTGGSSGGSSGKPFEDSAGVEWTTGNSTLDEDDLGDPSKGNNDDSNVGGWYDPSTGEFFQ